MPPASTEPASVYRELPPRAELRDLLACRWEQHVAPAREQRVVPDGCVDVVWVAGRELVVAGPATRATIAALPAGSTTVGLRFATGAAAAPLGLPLTALLDARVPSPSCGTTRRWRGWRRRLRPPARPGSSSTCWRARWWRGALRRRRSIGWRWRRWGRSVGGALAAGR